MSRGNREFLFVSACALSLSRSTTLDETNEWRSDTQNSSAAAQTTIPKKQGLRVHDNPALLDACRDASHVFPIFVLDPHFVTSGQYR